MTFNSLARIVLIKIDRPRRAEIGRERRARSRARILDTARILFTNGPIASVTVDDVTRKARLSRGAFYCHFRGLDELWAQVAGKLASAIRDFSLTSVSAADPVARSAAGCAAFIGEAQRDPDWGALFARGACAFPIVTSAARERLKANLQRARGEGRFSPFSTEVGRLCLRRRSRGHALGKRCALDPARCAGRRWRNSARARRSS